MNIFFRLSTVLLAIVLFTIIFADNSLAQDNKIADDESKKEAEELWELAIKAKGGRERLESVNNMVISGEYPVYYLVFRVQRNHQPKHLTFYNFPDKYWEWDDMRPSIFGLTVRMTNYENNTIYLFGSDSKEPCHPDEPDDNNPQFFQDNCVHQIKTREKNIRGVKQNLWMPQIINFMETKWVKPVPNKLTKGILDGKWIKIIKSNNIKKRKNSVDVIQTDVNGWRVDFALNSETHLPVRIGFYGEWGGKPNDLNEFYNIVDIPKYVAINDIQVPYFKGNDVQLNVDYDKSIFSIPTKVEDGPEAWKPKQ